MKVLSATVLSLGFIFVLQGSETLEHARQLEQTGDALGARDLLARAAQASPHNAVALAEYADFLDSRGDPGWKDAYAKLLAALDRPQDKQRRAEVARRMAELYLLEGDRDGAERSLEIYQKAAGSPEPPALASVKSGEARQYVQIPGPLHSFSRMAALSSDAQTDDVLPALARNVVTNGYQASHSNEAMEPTEYLKLVHRYLSQARELEKIAGASKTIRIDTCDSAQTGDLLRILGFRMRGGCGSELILETVNASRAFLTTDSGFPVPDLEQALRTNRPFVYNFEPSRVPILFGAEYWLSAKDKESPDFIDMLLNDPSLCRLYLGMSKLDRETAEALRAVVPMPRLKAFAHVLDFFGGMFEVRNGKAVVPGGAATTAAWADLAGGSPDQGGAFLEKLITKDDGWLASYYDALARINGPIATYLTEPAHLKRFYGAIRGRVTSPGPARPVFRANADMMLLTTRLWLDPDGHPHLPGGLQVWRDLFLNHPQGKYDGKLTRSAATWKDADDMVEALFGLTRKTVENEPLKIFMALSDLDRHRAQPLASDTVARLVRDYHIYGSQYVIFNDTVALSDKSILKFMDTADGITRLKDNMLRADTAGTLQALVGLWQMFTAQNSLPAAQADESFAKLLEPFAAVHNDRDLFDAGRAGVKVLLAATGPAPGVHPQDRMVDLLAGAANPSDAESHTLVVEEIVRVLESQRLVSLNDLFDMADHLDAISRGEKLNPAIFNRLAGRISELPMPRATLSSVERNALAFGYWTEKHLENERKLNLRASIDKASGEKVRDLRGLLTPFLRDTLVAYNYAHYAPPGAQVLYTNPMFVRGHDFLGVQAINHTWRATEVFGSGWPSNGGGRLVGSLAGLPYALAQAEQNFLIPDHTQALIWGDLTPQMMLSAVVPRWWNVTPSQLHWVALHLHYGESLLAASAWDTALRRDTLEVLRIQVPPARVRSVAALLETGDVKAVINQVTPSELFALASRMAERHDVAPSPLLAEMRRLAAAEPQRLNYPAISAAFGSPKPTLANSYRLELLNLRTFPTLMGYSSRILAESWESNALYWAEIADESYMQPSQLNVRVPEWTQSLVEHIFASHLEDWPAVLRSLHTVGDDVRAKTRQQLMAEQKAALQ